MICGLDISTSCIGICIKDFENKKVYFENFKPKGEDWIDKSSSTRDYLLKLTVDYDIKKIFIEENLQAFRPGLSSAKTLMSLARFNGIVSFLVKDIFSIKPEFINVNSARKDLGIKIDRKSELSTKEQVFKWVEERNNFPWPTRVLKSGKRKGQTILCDEVYDMADAYVIASAGEKLLYNVPKS